MQLEEVILRDTRANQPSFLTVPVGTLYFVTDENVTERNSGTAWQSYSAPVVTGGITQLTGDVTAGPGSGSQAATVANYLKTRQIGITVDGGGAVLTTGLKGFRSFPNAGTIIGVRLFADQVGSIVIDIWKDTYANFPPTVADTITAAAKPTIAAAQKYEDTTLTGWTTAVAAGDVFGFNIDSVATITRIVLELSIRISG